MWETCPEFLRRSARLRLEPTTSRSRVRRSTATPRRHPRWIDKKEKKVHGYILRPSRLTSGGLIISTVTQLAITHTYWLKQEWESHRPIKLMMLLYCTTSILQHCKAQYVSRIWHRQLPRYVYDGSFFIWHNRLILLSYETDRSIRICRINQIVRPTRMICFLIFTYT